MSDLDERVPTFSFTLEGLVAKRTGMLNWTAKTSTPGMATSTPWLSPNDLGLEDKGGLLRSGAVHYNTVEEIQRFGEVVQKTGSKNPAVKRDKHLGEGGTQVLI